MTNDTGSPSRSDLTFSKCHRTRYFDYLIKESGYVFMSEKLDAEWFAVLDDEVSDNKAWVINVE